MSNKSNGNSFENEFANEIFSRGFWAHVLVPNRNGQPFDVIAVNDHGALAVDCKDCQKDVFDISRIEGNQHTAMKLWLRRTGRDAAFALRFGDDEIWMVKYSDAIAWRRQGKKSISRENVGMIGCRLVIFLKIEGYIDENYDKQ